MLKYTVYKFFMMVFTLWIIVTSVFALMKVLPGSPFEIDQEIPEVVKLQLEEKYGLNQPIYTQYIKYIKNVAKMDFGYSYKVRGEKVALIIRRAFKHSFVIGASSITIASVLGCFLGIVSVKNKSKIALKLIGLSETVGIAIPNFILAIFFVYVFCEKLRWIPIGSELNFRSYIGPIIVLSIYPFAFIMKISREAAAKATSERYVLVFRSYGLSESKILYKYVIKSVLKPVITYLAPMIASIIMGAFAVEKIFLIPGLGTVFMESVMSRDYYVVFSLLTFYAAFYLLVIFVTDIFYCVIDPRVRSSFLSRQLLPRQLLPRQLLPRQILSKQTLSR